MNRFDAVVAAAVSGLSAREDYTLPEIASAAVKIASLVEHELAHLKERRRADWDDEQQAWNPMPEETDDHRTFRHLHEATRAERFDEAREDSRSQRKVILEEYGVHEDDEEQ